MLTFKPCPDSLAQSISRCCLSKLFIVQISIDRQWSTNWTDWSKDHIFQPIICWREDKRAGMKLYALLEVEVCWITSVSRLWMLPLGVGARCQQYWVSTSPALLGWVWMSVEVRWITSVSMHWWLPPGVGARHQRYQVSADPVLYSHPLPHPGIRQSLSGRCKHMINACEKCASKRLTCFWLTCIIPML